jgi:ATP-dependent protease ClpP protease subunit
VKHRQFINSALLDNNVGKIELWGDVCESQPIDMWTGQPLDIQCITMKDFKEALNKVQHCNSIELHLNSYGGDATVGIAIHNLLKATGKKITCVIDAVAASAAFTIAMAADEVQVYPGSILMCHEVKSFMFGYYGNDDLKKIENGNTAYNNSAASMYSKKSGMTKAQCLNLMKKETWMDAAEALSYGFADVLLKDDEDKPAVELINKTTMKINGVEHDISGLNIPEEFINKTNQLGGNGMSKESLKDKLINAISAIFKNEAEELIEIKAEVVEEVKEEAEIKEEEKQEPESVEEVVEEKVENAEGKEEIVEEAPVDNQEVVNSAIEAERKRIQEIEDIANGIDADLVQEAKFGNNACDAKELALRALQRDAEKTNKALEALKEDTKTSKVNEVESVQAAEIVDEENLTESQAVNAVKAMYAKLNQAKEGK